MCVAGLEGRGDLRPSTPPGGDQGYDSWLFSGHCRSTAGLLWSLSPCTAGGALGS